MASWNAGNIWPILYQILYISEYMSLVCDIINKNCLPPNLSCRWWTNWVQNVTSVRPNRTITLRKGLNSTNDRQTGYQLAWLETVLVITPNYRRKTSVSWHQLKLAKLNTIEHLNSDGSYEMFVNNQDEGLLMGKIQSRHCV